MIKLCACILLKVIQMSKTVDFNVKISSGIYEIIKNAAELHNRSIAGQLE